MDAPDRQEPQPVPRPPDDEAPPPPRKASAGASASGAALGLLAGLIVAPCMIWGALSALMVLMGQNPLSMDQAAILGLLGVPVGFVAGGLLGGTLVKRIAVGAPEVPGRSVAGSSGSCCSRPPQGCTS